ncbi:hypothetical protein HUW63_22590 [Myxococcus sp. AM001]|uniref:beta-ketoacyl synthase N-terminal-like domain-containing protein n=1 Tax=Myxococcus vastator TaxID=2709664 RepID=UPI0013D1A9E3|nr:beta-ketoacyl synthase N-terminal-like domain-containing protein [Myxococcus vastator]NVJ08016.1 hypothetical protein [Myxococcus sp. AM001]
MTFALRAMGAATSLGAVVQAAAAARAGIVRASELAQSTCLDEVTHERVALVGHTAGPLTEGFEGIGRLVQLAIATLVDLEASAHGTWWGQLEVFLCLPRSLGQGTNPPRDSTDVAQLLASRLQAEARFIPAPASLHLFQEERGGTIHALEKAMALLSERRCDQALVLGCDSLVSPERIEAQLDARRLKTPDHPVGYMPGEGAVALLLERRDPARERAAPPVAYLFMPTAAQEPRSLDAKAPPTGHALEEVLATALARAAATSVPEGSLYLDLNGEEFRAREWGQTLLRARDICRVGDWQPVIPAMSFGEVGTVSPLVSVCLAARAFARGYGRGRHALILVSGDDGHRAGLLLERGPLLQRPLTVIAGGVQ